MDAPSSSHLTVYLSHYDHLPFCMNQTLATSLSEMKNDLGSIKSTSAQSYWHYVSRQLRGGSEQIPPPSSPNTGMVPFMGNSKAPYWRSQHNSNGLWKRGYTSKTWQLTHLTWTHPSSPHLHLSLNLVIINLLNTITAQSDLCFPSLP